ncbi:hypothetical protein OJAV_G00052050 [Oryzias javanicus]|uniref:Uncharacterized protein n=1 Tax=Oryzias javanicus TaxID=123683 RepID=A0A437D8E2_ORYJA|nr:hypothetical protein OJAV_G00052050 [Oryzias javanicus]
MTYFFPISRIVLVYPLVLPISQDALQSTWKIFLTTVVDLPWMRDPVIKNVTFNDNPGENGSAGKGFRLTGQNTEGQLQKNKKIVSIQHQEKG